MNANKSQTIPMFVGLDPDPRLAEVVWAYKRRVRTLVGAQTFLDDPPHLTVYLAAFDEPAVVVDAMEQLAAATASPALGIVGWHVFRSDALTGGNTLVCQLADDDVRALRTLQHSVIQRIAPLRDDRATESRYAERLESLDETQRSAIRRCGFPYVGEHWHPHFTIASIRQSDWPTIEREMLRSPPQLEATCSGATLYRIDDGHPTSVRSFALRRPRETLALSPTVAS